MSKKQGYSHDWLISKNFTLNADGTYSPKPMNSEFIKAVKGEIIVKEKVIETPDFVVTPVTEWFINYSVPSKKNSRQNFVKNGKQISIPSKKHAEYVKLTAMQYAVFGKEFNRSVELLGLNYPLKVEFTFIRSTKHSFDYCNACQTCEDIMKGVWFEDDSADYLIPSFKPYQYDKNNPGVKIKLLK